MKSSSPSSDRFGAHPKALADLCVAMALRSQQYELGSQHLTVWPRITRGLMLKLLALGLFEDDLLGSDSRHRRQDSRLLPNPFNQEGFPTGSTKQPRLRCACGREPRPLAPGSRLDQPCGTTREPVRPRPHARRRGREVVVVNSVLNEARAQWAIALSTCASPIGSSSI